MTELQQKRAELLLQLDKVKDRRERNKMGQFATPVRVVEEMASNALQNIRKSKICYLEPNFGTSAFSAGLVAATKGERSVNTNFSHTF